jgi:hypothetical protein
MSQGMSETFFCKNQGFTLQSQGKYTTMMLRTKDIDISEVTSEQIGRCHKVWGPDNKPFYQVESESDESVEYEVRHTPQHGFTCTCNAGQVGFSNCKATCKHVRWSLACEAEIRAAMEELSSAEALAQSREQGIAQIIEMKRLAAAVFQAA